jgi:hypothetical protein
MSAFGTKQTRLWQLSAMQYLPFFPFPNFGAKKIFQKEKLRVSAFIHFYEMLSQLLVQFYRARSFTAVAPYALIAGE